MSKSKYVIINKKKWQVYTNVKFFFKFYDIIMVLLYTPWDILPEVNVNKKVYIIYLYRQSKFTKNNSTYYTCLARKNKIFLLLRELCLMSMGTCLRCAQSGSSKKNMPKNLTTCGKWCKSQYYYIYTYFNIFFSFFFVTREEKKLCTHKVSTVYLPDIVEWLIWLMRNLF